MLSINQKVNIVIVLFSLISLSGLIALYDYANGFALAAGSFLLGAVYMTGVYEANLEYLKRGDIK